MSRKKPVLPIAERDVLSDVLAACRALGIPVQRQNVGMATGASGQPVRFGKKGNADVSGTIPRGPNAGKRVEIEVKRKGKKPSPEQWDRIHSVNASGGLSFYVSDPADALRVLGRLLEGWHIEIDAGGTQWVTDEHGENRQKEGA